MLSLVLAVRTFVMCPLFWMPPSAMMGTPNWLATRATWYTAVAWPRPTAHTCSGNIRTRCYNLQMQNNIFQAIRFGRCNAVAYPRSIAPPAHRNLAWLELAFAAQLQTIQTHTHLLRGAG